MKKFLKEYAKLIGFTLTGLVFAYASFYLFLNFHHYQEIREVYYTDMANDVTYQQTLTNIAAIKSNLNFSANAYQGSIDTYFIAGLQSRLSTCVNELENETFQEMGTKDSFTLKDVSSFNTAYLSHVVNNCVVMQITDYLSLSNATLSQYDSFRNLYDASQLETKFITQSTSNLSNILKNNSSYYFNTTTSRNGVYNPVRDDLAVVLGSYEKASEYVLQVSSWLQSEVTK